jgi:hypothetical protein
VRPRRRTQRHGGARGERRGGSPQLLTHYRHGRNNALQAGAARIDHACGVVLRQRRGVGIGRRGRSCRAPSSAPPPVAVTPLNCAAAATSRTRACARGPPHAGRSATPASRRRRRVSRRGRGAEQERPPPRARKGRRGQRRQRGGWCCPQHAPPRARAARRRRRTVTGSQRLGGRRGADAPLLGLGTRREPGARGGLAWRVAGRRRHWPPLRVCVEPSAV